MFREPYLTRIKDALTKAYSIGWDECHKIYIAMDGATHDQQIEYGYKQIRNTDPEKSLELLWQWFDDSCGLEFIYTVNECDEFESLIPQFEYHESD